MEQIPQNNGEYLVTMNMRTNFTEFKEWNPKPLTIGLWRPYKVEVGFIEDYIKRESKADIILL
jgi:hypothetical protein